MSKQKTKLELTWIGKDKWPRLESRILLEQLAKFYCVKFRAKDKGVFDNSLQTAALTSCAVLTIVLANNTPPASRQISAPRGVTCFWSMQNRAGPATETAA